MHVYILYMHISNRGRKCKVHVRQHHGSSGNNAPCYLPSSQCLSWNSYNTAVQTVGGREWERRTEEDGKRRGVRGCDTLQHTATHRNTLQHTATHCNTLQHTATHVAEDGTGGTRRRQPLQHTATQCNTLQLTLPHTAAHTATHCNTPEERDGDSD